MVTIDRIFAHGPLVTRRSQRPVTSQSPRPANGLRGAQWRASSFVVVLAVLLAAALAVGASSARAASCSGSGGHCYILMEARAGVGNGTTLRATRDRESHELAAKVEVLR